MLSLRIKSRIYRYTGIYLARQEEEQHLANPSTLAHAFELSQVPDNELSFTEAKDLERGLWHARHGFCRPLSFVRFEQPAFVFVPIAHIIESIIAIKWDVQDMLARWWAR